MGKIGILVVETFKASGGAKRQGDGSLQSSGTCTDPGVTECFEKPEHGRNAGGRVLESVLEETLLNLSLKDIDKLARWVQGNEVLGREKILYLYIGLLILQST